MHQTFETLSLTLDDGLAIITLTRAERGNALAAQSGRDLRAVALACQSNMAVRAVLLRAEGKAFCVGGDLKDFAGQADLPAAVKDMTIDFHAALSMFARMDAPLVCAINGAAAGAGLTLTALADYAVAARSATFGYAYSGIGFTSDGGLTWLLPRLIGLRRFQSLVLTGRTITAEEALAMDIVSEVVDDDALPGRAEAMARKLAAGPTLAFGGIKRLTLESFSQGYEAHLEHEAQALIAAARSDDARNAIASVAQRQRPVFAGN